jgi:uncharacterized protein (TIGR03083 family)
VPDPLHQLDAARTWYFDAADALRDGGWQAASRCRGWTAAYVVAHVAGGDYLVRAAILDATGRDRSLLAAVPPDVGQSAQWARLITVSDPASLRQAAHRESDQTVSALREVLQQAPETKLRMPYGETPVTNALAIRTAEYVIHGYDLQPATGRFVAAPAWFIDATLPMGAQGMWRTHALSAHKGKSASFHLHRTDGDGEWTLRAENGQGRSEPGHEPADVAFRGPGTGLYWLLMGRGSPQELGVEVQGDPALAAAFKEWFPGP